MHAEDYITTLLKAINKSKHDKFKSLLLIRFYLELYNYNNDKHIPDVICQIVVEYISQLSSDQNHAIIQKNFKILSLLNEKKEILSIPEVSNSLKILDDFLFNQSQFFFNNCNLKNIYKSVEILYYFSKRLTDGNAKNYFQILLPKICNFREQQTPLEDYLKKLNNQKKSSVTKLGLADGLSGICLLLVHCCLTQPFNEDIKKIIEEYIIYLISLKEEIDFSHNVFSVLPDNIDLNSDKINYGKRFNWHDGDLGQSIFLYEAEKLFNDKDLLNLADLIGLNTLIRNNKNFAVVNSTDFFEGSSGIAYAYKVLFNQTKNKAYLEGYNYWITELLKQLDQQHNLETPETFEKNLDSLLQTGIVLLTYLRNSNDESSHHILMF